jgi:hypothetical protein
MTDREVDRQTERKKWIRQTNNRGTYDKQRGT